MSTLDAFLNANGLSGTYGSPPYYPHHPEDYISKFLFSKIGETGDKNNYRVIIPQREGYNNSDTAYITYCWFMVYAQRELQDGDLPNEIPPAFLSLRDEVLSFSKTPNQADGRLGLYIVFTQENNYTPKKVLQRNSIVCLHHYITASCPLNDYKYTLTLPTLQKDIKCDLCDKEWTDTPWAWTVWQVHRVEVHGVNERPNPLPQA